MRRAFWILAIMILLVALCVSIVVAFNHDDSRPDPRDRDVIIKSVSFYPPTFRNVHMVLHLDSGEVLDIEKLAESKFPILLNRPATLIIRTGTWVRSVDVVIDIKYR